MSRELAAAVAAADARIRPWVSETSIEASPIAAVQGGDLIFKLENTQHTGSFKARGAFNKLLSLDPELRARGVIAASTGNHGAAVSYAAGKLGSRARIVVASDASPAKLDAIRALGGEVLVHGSDSALAEVYARELAGREGVPYVSPYNDFDVVAGQGTIGAELTRQMPVVDAVFIALGGGGMLSGISAFMKNVWPHVTVVGCSPANSAVMIESVRAGRVLDLPSKPTLSDGTAGGLEPGAITLDWCRALGDEYQTVSEEEIRQAMRAAMETHHLAIEGAAGVALAAYMREAKRWKGKTVVVIICGGNVSAETLRSAL